uniref:Uncharacterized protein n=1 Tax=Arundo donax TaxID=35708 RepID=A0A0A9CU91_ARUDO
MLSPADSAPCKPLDCLLKAVLSPDSWKATNCELQLTTPASPFHATLLRLDESCILA